MSTKSNGELTSLFLSFLNNSINLIFIFVFDFFFPQQKYERQLKELEQKNAAPADIRVRQHQHRFLHFISFHFYSVFLTIFTTPPPHLHHTSTPTTGDGTQTCQGAADCSRNAAHADLHAQSRHQQGPACACRGEWRGFAGRAVCVAD